MTLLEKNRIQCMTNEMIESFCDMYCKHPCDAENQEELDETCKNCAANKIYEQIQEELVRCAH